MIYLSIFFLLFLSSLTKGRINRFLFHLFCVVLLFLSCLRAQTIGIDTAGGYLSYYNQILAGSNLPWVERSWVYLNRFSIVLGLGYQGVLAFAGLLTLLPVFYVISKTCKNKTLGLALFYGLYLELYSFNLVRQCIAISFILLAFFYFTNRRFFLSIVWFVAACAFHKSAIVSLALVLVLVRMDYKMLTLVIITSLVVGVLLTDKIFIAITGKYASNLLVSDGYSGFRDSIIVPFIFSAIISTYFIVVLMTPDYNSLLTNDWFWASVIGVVAMNLTMRLGQGTRIVLFFSQTQAIFIPKYLDEIENSSNKAIIGISFFIYLFLNFARILYDQMNSLIPYRLFFQM